MSEKEEFRGKVDVGTTVLWHPKGDMSRANVAFVVASSDSGIVDLVVLPSAGGGAVGFQRSVYHASHRKVLEDEFGRPNNNARNNGCWDFTEASRIEFEMLEASRSASKPKARSNAKDS